MVYQKLESFQETGIKEDESANSVYTHMELEYINREKKDA